MKTSTGVFAFDKRLSYKNSPSFGLGAGYSIRDFLQLNFSFSFVPTQQQISQAASVRTAEYMIYHYTVGIRLLSPKPLLNLQPYAMLGGGGMVINPGPVTIDLGLGNSLTVEPPVDHKFTGNIGIGLLAKLAKRIAADMKIQKYFFNLEGTNNRSIIATNTYGGVGLVWMF